MARVVGVIRRSELRLKSTADETLFLELALRGYDLSKLREEASTIDVIKIA